MKLRNIRKHFIFLLSVAFACLRTPAVSAESLITVESADSLIAVESADTLLDLLPNYIESGSFLIRRLNGLPVFSTPDSLSEVQITEQYVIVRPAWGVLEQEITNMLAEYQGDWSVYLKDLSTGRTIEVNEHGMDSASLIKLYIAGAVYEQIELGELEETSAITSALDAMITVSDNESANVLVRAMCDNTDDFQVGLAKVNDFIERYGFSNTIQINGIADPSLWGFGDGVNTTSPADCGHLLEMIYTESLVSQNDSARFQNLLDHQQVNYKIPSALPADVKIAHKTGEVSDTENDAAIIYTPYGDYIFCIMSNDLTDTGSAVDHIRTITKTVYDYFTGYTIPETVEENELVEYLPDEPYIIYQTSDFDDPAKYRVELATEVSFAADSDKNNIVWEIYEE